MPCSVNKASYRRSSLVLCLLLFVLLAATRAEAHVPQELRSHLVFGFLPIVSTHRLADRFAPIVDHLNTELGVEIRMETAPDFAEFIRRTRDKGRYDILFTAPHLYHLARRQSGYRAIARVDAQGMQAVITVPARSEIKTLSDLRGHTLATTGPLALSTLLVREQLLQTGLDPDMDLTLVSTPSHNASLLSSFQGTTDAAALMLPVYRRAPADVLDGMRVVAKTRSVPHIPIAVAPWMNETLATRLQQALIDLENTERGRALLARLGWPGFTVPGEHDYDSLEPVSRQIQVP